MTAFTNARPKVAPYPFTTKIPNLGVLRVDDEQDIIIADIPGIIEGASEGVGLGFDFLKHISRTSCLLFMIDCSDEQYASAYRTLCGELEQYSSALMKKPRIVLCNKIDIDGAEKNAAEVLEIIRADEPDTVVIPVSVMSGAGMGNAKNAVIRLVNRHDEESGRLTETPSVGKADFLRTRSVDEDMEIQYPGSEK